jgi:hypothetical protein
MKPIVYMLEIYHPSSDREVWTTFKSTLPFMSIQPGDLIDSSIWPGPYNGIKKLAVTQLEHAISERESYVEHKIRVFTQEIVHAGSARIETPRHKSPYQP